MLRLSISQVSAFTTKGLSFSSLDLQSLNMVRLKLVNTWHLTVPAQEIGELDFQGEWEGTVGNDYPVGGERVPLINSSY